MLIPAGRALQAERTSSSGKSKTPCSRNCKEVSVGRGGRVRTTGDKVREIQEPDHGRPFRSGL